MDLWRQWTGDVAALLFGDPCGVQDLLCQDGRALADVWRSTDGASWFQAAA